MLFPCSVHWLIWGKRRISFHFLLLPFRFPPPPAAKAKTQKEVMMTEFYSYQSLFSAANADLMTNSRESDVCRISLQ